MSQTERDRPSVLRAARERTRAEITREILDAARLPPHDRLRIAASLLRAGIIRVV